MKEADKIAVFSKKARVDAVFLDLNFYSHVANDNWFLNNKFNFVALNRLSDTTLFKSRSNDL
jgi:hypothetical protein